MANFVYTITLQSGGSTQEGIPVYGFAPIERNPADPLYKAKSAHDVKDFIYQAAGARGLTLAVPYPETYKYFTRNAQYDSLTIFPNDKPDDQFNTLPDTYTFDQVNVRDTRPMDWGSFSISPREMQWIYDFGVKNLKNKYGTDTPGVSAMYRPFAVNVLFSELR